MEVATRDATAAAHWYSGWRGCLAAVGMICGSHAAFALSCAQSLYRLWQGGNQWSGYDAYLTFFRYVAKLPLNYTKYDAWERLSAAGPRVLHADFCMVSERPITLTVDAASRPHNETGPFCQWTDGTALWAWHGVRVPPWVITSPALITAERVASETNQEVRRAMIERIGWPEYLRRAEAQPVQSDRFGELYRVRWDEATEIGLVVVTNSTPEPDGSYKRYGLTCELQHQTAHAAVAASFGLTSAQYQPTVES
jgi:hypothetical protein